MAGTLPNRLPRRRSSNRWLPVVASGVLLACGGHPEPEEAAPVEPPAVRFSLVPAHPSGWSCQRYGDVADELGDSFDSRAAEEAREYLAEAVADVLADRGLRPGDGLEEADAVEGLEEDRMIGLLGEICMESPDLLLEAAAVRVADGLP